MPMITTDRVIGKVDDLSKELALVNPNKAPLLINLMTLGKVQETTSTKISWVDYTCEGTQTVLTDDIASADTTVKVYDASVFKPGCMAVVGEEAIEVKDIVGNDLTVERGKLGTTAANHVKDDEIFYVNDNLPEGADLQGANYRAGKNFDNVTQIIREEISVSGTAGAIDVPSGGGVDAYSLEQIKKMDVVVGRTEKALVSGIKFEDGNKRGMGGIKEFLKDGQVVDAGGAEISIDIITQLLKKIYNVGGQLTGETYAIYISTMQKTAVSNLLKDYVTADPIENTLGAVADFINTDFGKLPFIMTPNLRSDEIIVINHDDLKVRPLKGRGLIHEFMGKKGDSTQGLVLSELTFQTRNIHTMGMITNLKK